MTCNGFKLNLSRRLYRMKKILLIAIGLFTTSLVSAQQYIFGPKSDYVNGSAYDPKFSVQVGADISGASVTSNGNLIAGPIHGYYGGFVLNIPTSELIDITPGLLFTQKGFAAVTKDGQFTKRTQFVEVPFLVNFKLNPIVSLFVGPQFSYLATSANTYDPAFNTVREQFYEDVNIKNYWVGVIGVKFLLLNHIEVNGRYAIDLQATPTNGNIYMPDYSNQVWQFGLGYKF